MEHDTEQEVHFQTKAEKRTDQEIVERALRTRVHRTMADMLRTYQHLTECDAAAAESWLGNQAQEVINLRRRTRGLGEERYVDGL